MEATNSPEEKHLQTLTDPESLKNLINNKTLKVPPKKVIVIRTNGITLQDWNEKFEGDTGLYKYIDCSIVQMLPGYNYVSGVDIYCDENGFMKGENRLATSLLGEYVYGGVLRGTICITNEETY